MDKHYIPVRLVRAKSSLVGVNRIPTVVSAFTSADRMQMGKGESEYEATEDAFRVMAKFGCYLRDADRDWLLDRVSTEKCDIDKHWIMVVSYLENRGE